MRDRTGQVALTFCEIYMQAHASKAFQKFQCSLFFCYSKKNLDALNKMLARDKELDTLCEKVFEEKILGNLSKDRFLKLSEKYENETN